jgi:hypothetical protein
MRRAKKAHPTKRAAGHALVRAVPPKEPRPMKIYTGTMTPTRRDLSDPRSSGKPMAAPRTPLLNDRRSTR